ncbi:TetR/AcrR family transcriptional regulator [Microbacterium sp. IEGM 1404]|uniref:TetR/AcrR family transcriptional regulator n=1 Tax=Microbacterium sp. IEGM 1404 TaxID=3047084 RepID=UPI0024B81096|nr:TetR/AcrR family transcriptional regulator [Microbacterium sp. IEGM 1404]MDI9890764.1 WHG domain-containing protein [Microbacterium sp. IEGM 1404]
MPRAGLDADVVVRRAAELVDAEGVASLTLSRVAAALGVAAPSLYKHVGGLGDLTDRLALAATRAFGDALARSSRGVSSRDALGALAAAYRGFARERPGMYELAQRGGTGAEWEQAAAEVVDEIIRALAGYGAGAADVHRIRYVRSALHGFTDLERIGGFRQPESVDETFTRLVDALDAELSRPVDGEHAAK